MAKNKKKRNKQYRGSDARVETPQVIRVSAEERTPFQEWWRTYGRIVKLLATVAGVVLVIVLVIIGLFGLSSQ